MPRKRPRVESVVFNGITFRRYPDAKRRTEQVYFTPGGSHRARGVGRLHQEIWKAAHGPIPEGFDTHHRDHDPDNNSIDNLVCVPNEVHRSHHGDQPRSDAQRTAWAANQQLAAEWHRSDEGRAWHSENGRRAWIGREPRTLACAHCGEVFETTDRNESTRFCSGKCRAYARKASGIDDVDRTCEGCGETFRINRYASTRNCSRACSWTVRRRTG